MPQAIVRYHHLLPRPTIARNLDSFERCGGELPYANSLIIINKTCSRVHSDYLEHIA